ncbi:hypothetical protein JKP88DRAFT_251992 [Tribonema minus]|uniref:Uncharacterized protein n=1 Tax=Tribonema minus TaxID=303371 RepID=A0A836CMG5_9STRA|nr:hypothetical protein JKP88DRAFT_251992 [Tribonema minus]
MVLKLKFIYNRLKLAVAVHAVKKKTFTARCNFNGPGYNFNDQTSSNRGHIEISPLGAGDLYTHNVVGGTARTWAEEADVSMQIWKRAPGTSGVFQQHPVPANKQLRYLWFQDGHTLRSDGSSAHADGGKQGPADLQSRYVAHQIQLQDRRRNVFFGCLDRALLDELCACQNSEYAASSILYCLLNRTRSPTGSAPAVQHIATTAAFSMFDVEAYVSLTALHCAREQETDDLKEGPEQAYRKMVDIYNGEGWLSNDGSVTSRTPFEDSGLVMPGLAHGREPARLLISTSARMLFHFKFLLATLGLSRHPERYAWCTMLKLRTRERNLFYAADGVARPEQAAGPSANGGGQASHPVSSSPANEAEEGQEFKAPEGGPLGVPLFGDKEWQERTHLRMLHRVPDVITDGASGEECVMSINTIHELGDALRPRQS